MKHSSQPYVPDDAGITVEALDFLESAAGRPLRAAAAGLFAETGEPSVAAIARVRKAFPGPFVQAALTLGRLQPKAGGTRGKFSNWPYVWATPEALEQATGMRVANHKALRFHALQPSTIVDLCAGIGGDALSLAQIASITAIDLSAVRLRCLELNSAAPQPPSPTSQRAFPIHALIEDVGTVLATLPRDALFHIDPARRFGGRRSPRWEDLIPGPDILAQVISHFRGGAIKLSPAVDFESLPPGHLEIISERGVVVQAVLWVGDAAQLFAARTRTATVLGQDTMWSTESRPSDVTLAPVPEAKEPIILYELDGAITRAGLATEFASQAHLQALTSDGGYLYGSQGERQQSLVLTAFEVVKLLPFSEKRVAEALMSLCADARVEPGAVEVKSRGNVPGVDTDRLQIVWSKITERRWTVLLFGRENEVWAAIAKRVSA
jgi:hypothetical protein